MSNSVQKRKRPRLGKRIARGILECIPLLKVEIEADECGGFQHADSQTLEDINAAIQYLEELMEYVPSQQGR